MRFFTVVLVCACAAFVDAGTGSVKVDPVKVDPVKLDASTCGILFCLNRARPRFITFFRLKYELKKCESAASNGDTYSLSSTLDLNAIEEAIANDRECCSNFKWISYWNWVWSWEKSLLSTIEDLRACSPPPPPVLCGGAGESCLFSSASLCPGTVITDKVCADETKVCCAITL